ncbi:beta-1,4 N-acetylgalactosaminyltransferase 2-like [Hemiscyllium ocellatum]|uniref:beta-1,4 N-acetylgalactosaminyltransferase 2-like n=1 Tax=Hemiscyllium ocellatum TaxID=170820 RepID=UPI0029666E80|nr:beta-1,4 N-acetylgalactosaminyltransferase 2-like [Hemiscyllium ocellatum]
MFSLQSLQRYVYLEPPSRWCALATYFFRQVHDLNYEMQLLFVYCDGVAAVVREPLLRNPHLRTCGFEWLSEGRAVATRCSVKASNFKKANSPHLLILKLLPFYSAQGWFAGRNLAASQVTTKYLLWVDEDFLFTKQTKVEKLLEVLENTNLDVVGGSVNGNRFHFRLWYEYGNPDDGECLFSKAGGFHPLNGFPNCVITSCMTEFFIDGLGRLLVGSCNDVIVGHQTHQSPKNDTQKAVEQKYARFRRPSRHDTDFKLALHYFKNHLKCYTKI